MSDLGKWYHSFGKRAFDLLSGIILLVIAFPFFLVIAFLVKLTSLGPIIFTQSRTGRKGKLFTLFKFRSMVVGAEKEQTKLSQLNEVDGPVFKIYHDPRFTRLGKLLAHSGLDELPQIINVIKGEMSLVGPRPLPVNETKQIPKKWRVKREQVKPGIVSSWVVKGAHNLKFSRWMELDIKDLNNSLTDDLAILLKSSLLILRQMRP